MMTNMNNAIIVDLVLQHDSECGTEILNNR